MLKRKTLRKSLLISFGIITAMILTLVAVIVFGMLDIMNANKVISVENNYVNHMYAAEVAHYKWGQSLSDALTYGTEFKGSKDPATCAFGKFIYSDEVQNNKEFQELLTKIEPIHDQIHATAEKALGLVKTDPEKAAAVYQKETMPNIENLIAELDGFIEVKNQNIAAKEAYFYTVLARVAAVGLITILVIVIAYDKMYFFIRKEVIYNLRKMIAQTKHLSEGNLNLDLDLNCRTQDMAELRDSLDTSVKELSKYVQAIAYGMEEFSKGVFTCKCPIVFLGDFAPIQHSIESFQQRMKETLVELELSASQVSSGASQVANGAQALAQGATEQASSVQELSATIAEVSRHISETAEYSSTADSVGKQAGDVVQRSRSEMKQLLQAIQDIAAASENIQKIIKAIDEIAFQTNILALNAAVEAARAGTAGKGFAVVADEVRNLAQKSAEAAQNTTELIENSLEHIGNGERLAKSTDVAFEEVANHAQNILEMVGKIAQASKEQAVSVSQISLGIEQISSVVQMNSATSEESAAASEELSGQVSVMKSLIDQFELECPQQAGAAAGTSVMP